MATREPPAELLYDPDELAPGAPRLYVWRNDNDWELLDEDGFVLSTHPSQGDAIEAARVRSDVRYSEILVRGSTGRVEWVVDQHPLPPGHSRGRRAAPAARRADHPRRQADPAGVVTCNAGDFDGVRRFWDVRVVDPARVL